MQRPDPSEYAPFYETYLSAVPPGEFHALLEQSRSDLEDLLRSVESERETYRYADDKWSIRELVGHVADAERLFAFRALHIARADPAPLPDMDQSIWAGASNAHQRPLAELTEEFHRVRLATQALFLGFDELAQKRTGVASGNAVSVRALGYILLGHGLHHHRVLVERYLAA